MIRKFILACAICLAMVHVSMAQCSEFVIDFDLPTYPDSNCTDGDMTVCILANVVNTEGSASWKFCSVSSNGTFCTSIFNTNDKESHTLCVAGIPCSESVQFYIDCWDAPDAGGNYCNRTFAQSTAALPVEFGEFTGQHVRGEIHLDWITLSETNSDFFSVERSENAKQFESIANIPAKGFSNLEAKYSFIDQTPFEGQNYYRLKEVSQDGSFLYSNILELKNERDAEDSEYLVFPNPVNNTLFIDAPLGNIQWELSNEKGQKLRKGTDLKIDMSTFNTGVYFIQLIDSNGTKEIKRIIKK